MKKVLSAIAFSAMLLAGAVEYVSDGIVSAISYERCGVIWNTAYKGTSLFTYTCAGFEYDWKANGDEKHNTSVSDNYEYAKDAFYKVDGKTRIYETNTFLGNKQHPDIMAYKVVTTASPNKMLVQYTMKLQKDLFANGNFVRGFMHITADVNGQKAVEISMKDVKREFLIPEKYDKKFARAFGKGIIFTLKNGTRFIVRAADPQTRLSLEDSRAWNGKNVYVRFYPELGKHEAKNKAGTEYKISIEVEILK